jgi:hypothetical protein
MGKIETVQVGYFESLLKNIRIFKASNGLDRADEDLAAALHIMNHHKLDKNAAIDQSSRGPNDCGIDAWAISADGSTLWIYQSKLTHDTKLIFKGLSDLARGYEWLETLLLDEKHDSLISEALFTLKAAVGNFRKDIKIIELVLLMPLDPDGIEATKDFDEFLEKLGKSKLNQLLISRGGETKVSAQKYNVKKSVPATFKKYQVKKIEGTKIGLRDSSHLSVSYIPLNSLVSLYRERGNVLFDKNVRLSLLPYKQSKSRVAHPMEETLNEICEGKLSPKIFPFYHVGVTLAASTEVAKDNGIFDLENPAVVNGCQTITIADYFLGKLEKTKDKKKIERFKEIPVLAKIVIGTTSDELREITNSNNRQNPIDNWQLFSNDEVHIQIEDSLRTEGIFYERQKGKFKTIEKTLNFGSDYPNTNNTFVDVPTLAQILCYYQGKIQWAAKVSEVFSNKENHNGVFNDKVLKDCQSMIFTINLWRAAKRGLTNYLESNERYSNDRTVARLFSKPIVKAHLYQVAQLYVWQRDFNSVEEKYKVRLNKAAAPYLIERCEALYRRVISKTTRFYGEHADENGELNITKRIKFFRDLMIEVGIDPNKKLF